MTRIVSAIVVATFIIFVAFRALAQEKEIVDILDYLDTATYYDGNSFPVITFADLEKNITLKITLAPEDIDSIKLYFYGRPDRKLHVNFNSEYRNFKKIKNATGTKSLEIARWTLSFSFDGGETLSLSNLQTEFKKYEDILKSNKPVKLLVKPLYCFLRNDSSQFGSFYHLTCHFTIFSLREVK